jgi:hypothetical protein
MCFLLLPFKDILYQYQQYWYRIVPVLLVREQKLYLLFILRGKK